MKQWAPSAPSQPPVLGSTRAQGDVSPDRYLGDHEAIGVVTQQTIAVLPCGSHSVPRWSGFEGRGLSWLQGARGWPAALGLLEAWWGRGRFRLGPQAPRGEKWAVRPGTLGPRDTRQQMHVLAGD